VPADGTRAATIGNGDFGTSPIFEQLSDKPLLVCTLLAGVSGAKHNGGSGRAQPASETAATYFQLMISLIGPRVPM
jgi:hypothetical protein